MKKQTIVLALFLLAFQSHATDLQRWELLANIQNGETSKFINGIYDDAVRVRDQYGIPLAITIGQAILETGHGKSRLCRENRNYFGIRRNHEFMCYDSKEACFSHYGRVLTASCYRNLQPLTLLNWYDALECCGYFTSKTYKRKLNNLIFSLGLDKLV